MPFRCEAEGLFLKLRQGASLNLSLFGMSFLTLKADNPGSNLIEQSAKWIPDLLVRACYLEPVTSV